VHIPRLMYPLKDAVQGGEKGKVVDALDVKVRTLFKAVTGVARGMSNAFMYTPVERGGWA
jgi:hypothetical protein